ncbi:DBF4-type zinc finger-containing protein 2 isoform X1 [Gracilinanus agilis]|uniref:DBF4-type zinc finger-containing protein 2 isoform X1 n=1 Tax=Gracilinanus agilis TaxID=191870 RepID=UPI001CFC680B|nr:DBF4-type zinc finger-containing protein 2 isoform X1 [Gracilinanus agilis]
MSYRIKSTKVASASSTQGVGRQAIGGSQSRERNLSLSVQSDEAADFRRSIMQNRQGYCNCCHVHYINLEQHIISPQHRYFATYCRYRMGTNSLLDRFLHDVMQYHPHQYYDNRPTYDDIPLLSRPSPPKEAQLDVDRVPEKGAEKGTVGDREDSPTKNLKSIADSGSFSYKSQKDMEEVSLRQSVIQAAVNEQQLSTEDPQEETMCIDNNMKKHIPEENLQTTHSSHKIQFTPVITEFPNSVNSLPRDPAVSPVATENASSSSPETHSVSVIKCTPNRKDTCNKDVHLDKCPNSFESSLQLGTSSVLRQSPKVGQGNSLDMTSDLFCSLYISELMSYPQKSFSMNSKSFHFK